MRGDHSPSKLRCPKQEANGSEAGAKRRAENGGGGEASEAHPKKRRRAAPSEERAARRTSSREQKKVHAPLAPLPPDACDPAVARLHKETHTCGSPTLVQDLRIYVHVLRL